MRRQDREARKAAGCFLRLVLIVGALVIALAAFAALYTGAKPTVSVKPAMPGIGRRTPIQIRIDDPQRVEKVRVEVVQGMDVKPVMEKAFKPRPAWKFWGSPPPVELTAEVGRETVQGLRTGEATVRVTAERAGSLLPAAGSGGGRRSSCRCAWRRRRCRSRRASITSTRGAREVVVYRVGEGAVRDGVQSGDWWFPASRCRATTSSCASPSSPCPTTWPTPPGVRLVAEDEVGNRAEAGFIDKFTPRPLDDGHHPGHRCLHEQGGAGDHLASPPRSRTRATC